MIPQRLSMQALCFLGTSLSEMRLRHQRIGNGKVVNHYKQLTIAGSAQTGQCKFYRCSPDHLHQAR